MSLYYLKRSLKNYLLLAVLLSAVVMIALSVFCVVVAGNTAIEHRIEIWIHASDYVDMFLPLLVCVAFVPFIHMQVRNGFVRYAGVRMGKKRFISTQLLAIGILAWLSIAVAYYIPLLLSMTVINPSMTLSRGDYLMSYVFGQAQVNSPLLFGAVWCVWKGFLAVLFAMFGCLLALNVNNLFVSVLIPFLYCMVENLITAILQIPEYSIITSLVLNRLSPERMHIWNYGIGALTFAAVSSLMVICLRKRGRYAA